MLRFWLLGAIILTAAVNAIYTGICIGECVSTSTGNQYLPHKQCDKYCVCVSGQPQVFHCEPNNHWSQEYEICTHPAEAKCQTRNNTAILINALDQGCKTKCPQNESTFVPHNDCEKYCLCSNNIVTVLTCPKGHFSVKSNSCAPVEDAGCIKNDSKPKITRLTIESTTVSIITDNECIGSCPELEDPSHTVYLAHRNCSEYCHCKNGHPIIKSCLPYFLFSLKDMRCRQPKDVDCDRVNSTTAMIIPSSDKAIKRGCRTQCPRYNALVPHEKPSKLCLCRDGKVTILKCPRPYYFSTDCARCVCRKNAKLTHLTTSSFTKLFFSTTTTKVFSSTSLPLSAEPVSSTIEPLPPSTIGMTEEFSNCVETCPDSGSDYYDVYYNVSHRDCNKYCECYEGNIIKVVECSAGYNFDKFFRICDESKYADCYDHDNFASSTTILSTSSTKLPLITKSSDDVNNCLGNCPEIAFKSYDTVVNLPHEQCNKYCECYRGEIKVKECPLTHQFDWIHRECIISENASCLNHTISMTTSSSLSTSLSEDPFITISPEFTDDYNCVEACPSVSSANYDEYVKIPHRDCTKYCECYRGTLTVILCPFDSYYDCYFQTCDVPKYATCYDQYASPATPVPSDPSTTSPEITENCIGKCSEVSKMNYAIFLKHKQCQKFCECFEGRLTVKSCPINSYFNSNLGLCDQAKYVECHDDNETSTLPRTSSPDTSDCLGVCVSDDVYLIPHKHCAKYCECDLGYIDVKCCPSGTYFNGFTKRCEDTEYDDCTKMPEASVTILSEYVEGCAEECPYLADDTRVAFIPHKQCEKYCLCGSWEKPLVMSCGPNSHFNPTRKKCDYIENAGCKGIAKMNTTFVPHIIPVPIEDRPDYHDKSKLYTILLKISGIKNGSEIDLKIGNPDNTVSTSSGDGDAMNFEDIDTIIKKDIDEERRFPKDPNGLVTILANLKEKAQCFGECPETYLDEFPIYLRHQNCHKACKCSISGPRVMECHNKYYWNPVTEKCDPIIYSGCTEVVDNYEDEPKSKDSPFDEFKKLMGW